MNLNNIQFIKDYYYINQFELNDNISMNKQDKCKDNDVEILNISNKSIIPNPPLI